MPSRTCERHKLTALNVVQRLQKKSGQEDRFTLFFLQALWLHQRFLAQVAYVTHGEAASPVPSDDAGGPVPITHDALRLPREDSETTKFEEGHAFVFPVWQSEDRMLNIANRTEEIHESKSAVGLNDGATFPSFGSRAHEDAFVAELVGRARASGVEADSSTHAQLLLSGRHKLWARTMLCKEKKVSI